MTKIFKTIADRLSNLAAVIASVGILFEVVVILADVIGRFFGAPFAGSQDLSQMTLVLVIFGGMALCDRSGGHVSVDIFESAFPERLNQTIDCLACLLGAALFLLIAYTVYESSKLSLMLNLSTNILNMPKVYFQWSVVGFSILTALTMVFRSIDILCVGRVGTIKGGD